MADEAQYSSGPDSGNKRKYEEQTPPSTRRVTGFSAPIKSSSPDSAPTSYSSVPPPMEDFQLAKQKAQEIAARLLNGGDAKRSRVDNGGSDSIDKGFSSGPPDLKPHFSNPAPSSIPVSYGGFQGSSKKIEVPNGRVGVIIGKGGETIKYLQTQSGAKIQVTRDSDADLNFPTRMVELMGTPEQIAKAEHLINEVLAEAESGGPAIASRRLTVQAGGEQYVTKIPNNKVGLVIGKGGETIKSMQARTGARIQVIPLHLPPGDTSTERTLQIDGTTEQIEAAKQLVAEVISEIFGGVIITTRWAVLAIRAYWEFSLWEFIYMFRVSLYWTIGDTNMESFVLVIPQHHSGMVLNPGFWYLVMILRSEALIEGLKNRVRNPAMSGGYSQQGYQARPPSGWAPSGPPMQPPSYGYGQSGAYSGPPQQYNSSQPSYPGYPPQPTSGGYPSSWDQSAAAPTQQTTQGGGYDYYGQQQPSHQQQNPGGPTAPADSAGYNYGPPPVSGYNQQGQGYAQDGYGGYHAPPQSGYGQPPAYDQQQGYSAAGYGNVSNPPQDGHTPSYGTQGDSAQAPPAQQGYNVGQQPSPNPAGYPPQGSTQPGYGAPPTSQTGYGSQPPAQPAYGAGYGAPPAQKPPANPAVYGQTAQSPSTPGGYGQPAPPVQPGYPHSQPPTSAYAQPDPATRPPSSGYGAAAPQTGYGPPSYGAPPAGQPGYGQAPPPYNASYGAGYAQPPPYSADASTNGNTRGTYDAPPPASQTAPPSGGVAKTSPQS
ncbi:hypothetical protein ACFX10_016614 [Malus domestica]